MISAHLIEVDAVVLTAMPEEMAPFKERADSLGRSGSLGKAVLRLATFGSSQVLLVTSGIGLVNAAVATTLALTRCQPGFVVSAGSAGGLHADVQVGDVVAGTTCVFGGADAQLFGYVLGQVPGMPVSYAGDPDLLERVQDLAGGRLLRGQITSGDAFVGGTSVAGTRARFPEALATDMESAAIAQTCHVFAVPFLSVRAISDLCGPQAGQDHHLELDVAAARSAEVALALIARPVR
ncbi:MAG: 5'-methylthioadenosine/S-adenosylhomocysteine nucleosidase [Cellulomonas sp.]